MRISRGRLPKVGLSVEASVYQSLSTEARGEPWKPPPSACNTLPALVPVPVQTDRQSVKIDTTV